VTRPPYVLLELEDGPPESYDLDHPARPMPEPFRWLAAAISDISEDCWCAGWLDGCEWSLLDALDGGPREWGQGLITAEQLANLRSIREACDGGWVRWVEGRWTPDGYALGGVVHLRADEVDAARRGAS
jgi:hypothetical protein